MAPTGCKGTPRAPTRSAAPTGVGAAASTCTYTNACPGPCPSAYSWCASVDARRYDPRPGWSAARAHGWRESAKTTTSDGGVCAAGGTALLAAEPSKEPEPDVAACYASGAEVQAFGAYYRHPAGAGAPESKLIREGMSANRSFVQDRLRAMPVSAERKKAAQALEAQIQRDRRRQQEDRIVLRSRGSMGSSSDGGASFEWRATPGGPSTARPAQCIGGSENHIERLADGSILLVFRVLDDANVMCATRSRTDARTWDTAAPLRGVGGGRSPGGVAPRLLRVRSDPPSAGRPVRLRGGATPQA